MRGALHRRLSGRAGRGALQSPARASGRRPSREHLNPRVVMQPRSSLAPRGVRRRDTSANGRPRGPGRRREPFLMKVITGTAAIVFFPNRIAAVKYNKASAGSLLVLFAWLISAPRTRRSWDRIVADSSARNCNCMARFQLPGVASNESNRLLPVLLPARELAGFTSFRPINLGSPALSFSFPDSREGSSHVPVPRPPGLSKQSPHQNQQFAADMPRLHRSFSPTS